MKIQTGNFGNALPQDQGVRRVADTNAGAIAQGAAQLAQTGQQVIMQQQAKDLQEFEQKKATQERITSLTKLTAAELEADRIGGELYDRVKRGEIDTTTAQTEYSKTWSEFQKTQLSDVADPEHKQLLGAQFGQYQARQYGRFNIAEREAFDAKAKGDFTGLYDNIVQLSIKDPVKAKQKLADALMVARSNAARLSAHVEWRQGDWFKPIGTGLVFDLIVSNPPYIAQDEMAGLSPDVLNWEPHSALTPGGDGLGPYRIIARDAPSRLMPGGRLLVEIGPTQGAAVAALFAAQGLQEIRVLPDMDGRDRVVVAVKPSADEGCGCA